MGELRRMLGALMASPMTDFPGLLVAIDCATGGEGSRPEVLAASKAYLAANDKPLDDFSDEEIETGLARLGLAARSGELSTFDAYAVLKRIASA
jgi:hypothetical protein